MAEKGAFLTSTTQTKPSIFEVVAQDTLSATVHPAVKRIVEFLASCNPERYSWLVGWYEEVFLVVNGFLQHYYLKYYGASFAETFYGLQRASLQGLHLSQKARAISLLCLVIFPYARSKLDILATKFLYEEADGIPPSRGWTTGSRKAVIFFHKWFNTFWELGVLVQYVAYLSGRATSHSPLLRLAKLTLQYPPEESDRDELEEAWNNASSSTPMARFSLKSLGSGFIQALEVGAFFLQFLQWWQAEKGNMDLTALPIPPPPVVPVETQRYCNKCPICLEKWRIPTVLPVSGFMFCYSCIVKYLKEHGCCPVTKYPASAKELIRVYK